MGASTIDDVLEDNAQRGRRSNGSGAPRLRPDGRWEVRFAATERATHNRVRKSVYGATRSEALEAMRRLLEDPAVAGPPTDARCTVRTWVLYWSRMTLESDSVPEVERDLARGLIQGFLMPSSLAQMALRDVEPSDVKEFRQEVWRRAAATATAGGTPAHGRTAMAGATSSAVTSLLRSAFARAVSDRLLRVNPASPAIRSALPDPW